MDVTPGDANKSFQISLCALPLFLYVNKKDFPFSHYLEKEKSILKLFIIMGIKDAGFKGAQQGFR